MITIPLVTRPPGVRIRDMPFPATTRIVELLLWACDDPVVVARSAGYCGA